MATITLKVSCDCAHWMTVDDIDVPLTNGRGAVHGVAPGQHGLIWAVMGNPGDSFSAVLKIGDDVICEVEDWKIPDDDGGWTGGYKYFAF